MDIFILDDTKLGYDCETDIQLYKCDYVISLRITFTVSLISN